MSRAALWERHATLSWCIMYRTLKAILRWLKVCDVFFSQMQGTKRKKTATGAYGDRIAHWLGRRCIWTDVHMVTSLKRKTKLYALSSIQVFLYVDWKSDFLLHSKWCSPLSTEPADCRAWCSDRSTCGWSMETAFPARFNNESDVPATDKTLYLSHFSSRRPLFSLGTDARFCFPGLL